MVCGGLLQGSRPAPQARRLPRVSISRSRLLCVRRVAATLSARTSVAHVSAACAWLCAARVSLQSHGPWLRMCIAHTIGHSMPPCAGRGEDTFLCAATPTSRQDGRICFSLTGWVACGSTVQGGNRRAAVVRCSTYPCRVPASCACRHRVRLRCHAPAGGAPTAHAAIHRSSFASYCLIYHNFHLYFISPHL